MRKGTFLTSSVLDEITAKAHFQDLLDDAAQRQLDKAASAGRKNQRERILLAFGERLVDLGKLLKAQTASPGTASHTIETT